MDGGSQKRDAVLISLLTCNRTALFRSIDIISNFSIAGGVVWWNACRKWNGLDEENSFLLPAVTLDHTDRTQVPFAESLITDFGQRLDPDLFFNHFLQLWD